MLESSPTKPSMAIQSPRTTSSSLYSKVSLKRDLRRDTAEVSPPSTVQPPLVSIRKVFLTVSGLLTNTMESSLIQKVSTRVPHAPNKSESKLSMKVSQSHENDDQRVCF